MKKIEIALAAAALGASAGAQVRPDAVLLRMPDISQDQIVFRYANDLWLVEKAGGVARPLSSPEGAESFPKFSPDGSKIAFVGGYDGGTDLYVLDLAGGVPVRVTHHPAAETLCDWMPDGKSLLFFSSCSSGQQRAPKMFKVDASGGQPEELPVPYGTFGSTDESGDWLAYTPVAASEFRTWKRYQGGLAQDIWLFSLKAFESRRMTDHPGTDALPMWHGHEVYFLSDRDSNARLNLWVHDVQKRTFAQVTDFVDADVRFPSIGPADIVFENEGRLWRYEFATRKTVAVEVTIPGDRPKLRKQTMPVSKYLEAVEIGPNGVRVAVEARGEVFSVPVEQGVTRNLTRSDGFAERSPAWSPDGQWIAYWSDESGEYELCVRRGDGAPFQWQGAGDPVEVKQLTQLGAGWKYAPSFAPDSKSLVFCSNAGELFRLVLSSGEIAKIATNPSGDPFEVDWSPDSRWIAWSHRSTRTHLGALYLYDVTTSELHEVTSGRFDDGSPSFDRGGEWLYFLSQRTFEPSYSDFDDSWIYANSANLMAVPLRRDVKNPLLAADPREDEAPQKNGEKDGGEEKAKTDGESSEAAESKDDAVAAAPKPVQIDLDGFEGRAIPLPVDPGELRSVQGGKGKVFYRRAPRTGSGDKHSKVASFEIGAKRKERKEKVVVDGVADFQLAAGGKKLLVRLPDDGGYAVLDAKPEQKIDDKLDLSGLEASIDPREEWRQILGDAHRVMRDFFYEPGLHGVDWSSLRARFDKALADATSRDDVHYLLGEMISELNVGHAYNSGGPGVPETAPPGRSAGLLGCDWKLEQGAYRVARILGLGSPEHDARGPLAQPGIDAREGDFLLAVNGVAPDPRADVYAGFLGLAGEPTELLLNAAPARDGNERRVVVTPIESENELRYRDWVERNRKLVDERSSGRIAYVHVPDTGRRGQSELVRQLSGQFHRDALLVDERWNSGGQIPTRFVELLGRPRTNFWAVRHGEDWVWPPFAHHGPKAMLINGSSGSGGDAFPYYFRQSKLGALIGQRTWGGLVGISGNPKFVDGSSITVPRFAFYETDGTWGVEGYGISPDQEVIDDPTLMVNGDDPQLLAGIAHLLKELETFPFQRPARPAPPNRVGAGVTPQDR